MIRRDGKTVFIFPSNLAGRHDFWASKIARYEFGAEYGVARGLTGDAYGIPIWEEDERTFRPIEDIEADVRTMFDVAAERSGTKFFVSTLGFSALAAVCPLARTVEMFIGAPDNVLLPPRWKHIRNRLLNRRSARMSETADLIRKASAAVPGVLVDTDCGRQPEQQEMVL